MDCKTDTALKGRVMIYIEGSEAHLYSDIEGGSCVSAAGDWSKQDMSHYLPLYGPDLTLVQSGLELPLCIYVRRFQYGFI
jgi:hypothetical protein